MADEPLKTCPTCGKAVRRLINGGTGVIFKGGGFYVTDKAGSSVKAASKSAETKPAGTEAAPCSGCAKSEACPKAANS